MNEPAEATRNTRYVLRRGIRNLGGGWPLFRIGADGRAAEWAELEALDVVRRLRRHVVQKFLQRVERIFHLPFRGFVHKIPACRILATV